MSIEILTSDVAELGFFAVMVLFIMTEIIGVGIIPMLKRRGSNVQRGNRESNLLVLFSWIAALLVAQAFAKSDIALLPNWAYYLASSVMLTGIAVRQWAIAILGRYFSGVIGVQEGQTVVESGPSSGKASLIHWRPSDCGWHWIGLSILGCCIGDRSDLCDLLWSQNVGRGKGTGSESRQQLRRIHEEDKKADSIYGVIIE